MKEKAIISNVLKKYDLTLPLTWREKRRIKRAKKRTLVNILAGSEGGAMKLNWSLAFYNLMQGLGLNPSPASGARMAFAASAFCLMIAGGGVLLMVQNYGFITLPSQIAESEKSMGGTVSILSGTADYERQNIVKNIRTGNKISAGDRITASKDSSLFLNLDGGAVISIMNNTQFTLLQNDKDMVRIELKKGYLMSKVPSPFNGVYEIITPDASVKVTGTVFSVVYADKKTSVSVLQGTVSAVHTTSGAEGTLKAGDRVEADKKMTAEKIREKEKSLLNRFSDISLTKITPENSGEKKLSELNTIYKEMNHAQSSLTLEGIRKKYGKIDQVILYSGRKYTGAILSRGASFRIITVRGVVKVPAKNIKTTNILK